jgi:hypothetical protein
MLQCWAFQRPETILGYALNRGFVYALSLGFSSVLAARIFFCVIQQISSHICLSAFVQYSLFSIFSIVRRMTHVGLAGIFVF